MMVGAWGWTMMTSQSLGLIALSIGLYILGGLFILGTSKMMAWTRRQRTFVRMSGVFIVFCALAIDCLVFVP